MNLLRKIIYLLVRRTPKFRYKYENNILYRQKKTIWGELYWVEDDYMLSLMLSMKRGEQCVVDYTDYPTIGSDCIYMFDKTKKECTYSSGKLLINLNKDYIKLIG